MEQTVMSQTDHPLSRRTLIGAGAVAAGFALASPPARAQADAGPAGQAVIRTDPHVVTLVSVFKVEPDTIAKLLDVLREGTETFFSRMPGFVSSSVLVARDGHHAINYSQWRSTEDIDRFRRDPRFAPYIQRLRPLATPETFDCEVAYVDAA
jgi:quinol monooxygenase YgiN